MLFSINWILSKHMRWGKWTVKPYCSNKAEHSKYKTKRLTKLKLELKFKIENWRFSSFRRMHAMAIKLRFIDNYKILYNFPARTFQTFHFISIMMNCKLPDKNTFFQEKKFMRQHQATHRIDQTLMLRKKWKVDEIIFWKIIVLKQRVVCILRHIFIWMFHTPWPLIMQLCTQNSSTCTRFHDNEYKLYWKFHINYTFWGRICTGDGKRMNERGEESENDSRLLHQFVGICSGRLRRANKRHRGTWTMVTYASHK